MPSTQIFVGLPENSKSSITKMNDQQSVSVFSDEYDGSVCIQKEDNQARPISGNDLNQRVPNAPKSSIGEIFSSDSADGRIQKKNGISSSRPRALRDTPVKPKDTHSRLFGQAASNTVVPMVTDTIRSNIQFGEAATNGHTNGMNGHSPLPSPTKVVFNGTGTAPSRGEVENGEHSIYGPPKRNPVTGDGVILPRIRKPHPSATTEGNPITGDGYKKKTTGLLNSNSNTTVNFILYKRVPPGGYSSGLW